MKDKLYLAHDPQELEPHYCLHVEAMTAEGLHEKSDIAIQLAWRDKRIAELTAELLRADRALSRAGLRLERDGAEHKVFRVCEPCGGEGEVASVPGAGSRTCSACQGFGRKPVTGLAH